MKVVIATCFESNEERVSFVLDACKSRNYATKVYTTDFSHIKKQKRESIPNDYEAIETAPYSINLSLNRIKSHRKFANELFKKIENDNPDLIWLMAPANSLIAEAKQYKTKHPQTKLIIDIIDMWPESLPLNINKNIFPFNLWKNIRKNNIKCADALVSECDLYHEELKKEYENKITTIHWCKDAMIRNNTLKLPDDKLSLCYIGSINNIIDIDKISKIIEKCDMPVVLHVIGEGGNRYNFVNVNNRVCEVIYYGPIRNEKEKAKIFSSCHAGINVYKENLYIGLTVKSIDYFEHGLPIINNIKGDTWNMVEKYKVGINVTEDSVVTGEELIKMRKDKKIIYKLFKDNFSKDVFIKKCLKVIDEVIK